MPRPTRIEYENAFYHVMNRGAGRQTIFPDDRYYQLFLDTIAEAHVRFSCLIHAYCLMGNHYHLLIETPRANLGRVMRHINGVYTQRYNRLKKTDGPLFRGRYKAILVDRDAYLLQLSRYIHRNPIDCRQPLCADLLDYPWSSFPCYTNKVPAPDWLYREKTYLMLGHKQRYKVYRAYVDEGTDVEILGFYGKGNQTSVVGGEDFRGWVYDELLPDLESEKKVAVIEPDLTISQVIEGVAKYYKVSRLGLLHTVRGRGQRNLHRKLAMYLCQELASARLVDIAREFNLGHIGSVSFITHQIRQQKKEDRDFAIELDDLIVFIMKKLT